MVTRADRSSDKAPAPNAPSAANRQKPEARAVGEQIHLPLQRKAAPPAPPNRNRANFDRAFTSGASSGLPGPIKSGVEQLSGMAMDDVQVHYNSQKPAQLKALAYTQGSNIYVGPGQETHLAHEAWHVVQQKQGRVQPSVQLKGMSLNTDSGLEAEADAMGARVLALTSRVSPTPFLQQRPATGRVAQAKITAKNLKELVEQQTELQKDVLAKKQDYSGQYTTVGFEHEFAQMTTGPLRGVSHLELSDSTQKMPYVGLPFSLETDASNALELVCPPLLIQTLEGRPIPLSQDVIDADQLIKDALLEGIKGGTIGRFVQIFAKNGITFPLRGVTASSKNMTPNTPYHVSGWERGISQRAIENTRIELSKKQQGRAAIDAQVNFATDAEGYDLFNKSNDSRGWGNYDDNLPNHNMKENVEYAFDYSGREFVKALETLESSFKELFPDNQKSKNQNIFIRLLNRTLASQIAVPAIHALRKAQKRRWKGGALQKITLEYERFMSSYIKDIRATWLKDTLMNFGLGILDANDWKDILGMLTGRAIKGAVGKIKLPKFDKDHDSSADQELFAETVNQAIAQVVKYIHKYELYDPKKKQDDLSLGPKERPDFMRHDPQWIGVRQDTYIPHDKVQRPDLWGKKRLHVVEARRVALTAMENLEAFARREIEAQKPKLELKIEKEKKEEQLNV